MALKSKLSSLVVNVQAEILSSLLDNGYLRLYGGDQPETGDTKSDGQEMLYELRFGKSAFKPAVKGVITAHPISKDMMANVTGKATWYRCFSSDGVTGIMDGSVGIKDSGSNLELNSVDIQAGAEVGIDFFQHRVPRG